MEMEGKIVSFPELAICTGSDDNEQRRSRSSHRLSHQCGRGRGERSSKKSRSRQRRRRPTKFEGPVTSDVDCDAGESTWQAWDNDETERQQYLLKKKQRALCRELERCRDDYTKGKEWMHELRRSVLGTLKENEEWINVAQYALEQCEAASAMNADLVEENKRLYEENLYFRSLVDRHEISERKLKATMTQKQQQLAKENERLWEAYHVGKTRMKNMQRDQKEAFKAIDFCMRTEVQQKDMQWRKERQQLERRLAKYETQLERMAQPFASRTENSSDTPPIRSGSDRDNSPDPPGSSHNSNGTKHETRDYDRSGGSNNNDDSRERSKRIQGSSQPESQGGTSFATEQKRDTVHESLFSTFKLNSDRRFRKSLDAHEVSMPESKVSLDVGTDDKAKMGRQHAMQFELSNKEKGKGLPPTTPFLLSERQREVVDNQDPGRRSSHRSNFGLAPGFELFGPNGSVHDKLPRRNSLKDDLCDFQKKEIIVEKRAQSSRSVSPSARMKVWGEKSSERGHEYEKLHCVAENSRWRGTNDDKDEKSSPSRTETASTEASTRTPSKRSDNRSEAVLKAVEEEYNIISTNVGDRLNKLVKLAKRQQESLIVAATSGAVGDDISCSSYIYQQLLRDSVELEEVADQIRSKMAEPRSKSKPGIADNDSKMPQSLEPISVSTNRQFVDAIPPLLPPEGSSSQCLSSSDKSKIDSYNGSAPSIVMDKDGMPVFASLVPCPATATASLIPEAVAVPVAPTTRPSTRRHQSRLRKLRGSKRGVAKIMN